MDKKAAAVNRAPFARPTSHARVVARKLAQEQLAPLETRLVPVSYANAQELQPRVRELLTERGSVVS